MSLEHWSRYWETGHLTSLPDDFAGVYDGEIENFWAGLAKALPTGARVLDVCAGNGPVALLIARHADAARVWAADAAAIDPGPVLARRPALADLAAQVTFLPGTPAETLADTIDEQFALVTSQYGVEYTDWPATARSIAEVLEPGGTLALVAHVPTSAMVETMEAEQSDYARLSEAGALEALRELGAGGSGGARKRLKRALTRLRPDANGSALLGGVVHGTTPLLAMSPAQLAAQQPAIRQYAADLVAGRDRARDLLRANRRILESPRWFDVFTEAGLTLEHEQELLYGGRHRCGLALVFRKPADLAA